MSVLGVLLEFVIIREGGHEGEYRHLYQCRSIAGVAILVAVVVALVHKEGVLVVVEVVDADADGAIAVFELFVEVDANVHTVVGGQAEGVA